MRRKIAAVLIGLSLMVSAAACGNPDAATPSQPQQEQEDCDWDDLVEGDEDCGFLAPDKPSKPKLKTTPKPFKSPTKGKR